MDIRDALGQARSALNSGLKGWENPNVQLLPTDPAHAACCLCYALRCGRGHVAYAATKTLALFAEHLLWQTLLAYSATETAAFGPTPTLCVMAAKRDRAWIRRKGGLSRVGGYLAEVLMKAPRSMDAIYLWRLSFDVPETVPAHLEALALDARALRRGMLELLGYEEGHSDGRRLLDKLKGTPESALSVDVANAAFRQAIVPEALMIPLLHRQLIEATEPIVAHGTGWYIGSSDAPSERPMQWVRSLTKDTPAGRRAIRAIMASIPDLRIALDELGLDQEGVLEVVAELIQRQDDQADPEMSSRIIGLRKASQWSGVGPLKPKSAQAIGSILAENWSAVDEIRLAHIPPSLIDLA